MKNCYTAGFAKIRQKLLIFSVSFVVALSLVSCRNGGADPLSYRYSPLSAEIAGRISPSLGENVDFSATLELGEYTEGATREFSLLFHAPESLSGMLVRRFADGRVTLSSGGLECPAISDSSVARFIKIAGMLDVSEEILGISSIPGASVGLNRFERLTLVETASYRIVLDPHTAYPVRVEFSDGDANIYFDAVTSRI